MGEGTPTDGRRASAGRCAAAGAHTGPGRGSAVRPDGRSGRGGPATTGRPARPCGHVRRADTAGRAVRWRPGPGASPMGRRACPHIPAGPTTGPYALRPGGSRSRARRRPGRDRPPSDAAELRAPPTSPVGRPRIWGTVPHTGPGTSVIPVRWPDRPRAPLHRPRPGPVAAGLHDGTGSKRKPRRAERGLRPARAARHRVPYPGCPPTTTASRAARPARRSVRLSRNTSPTAAGSPGKAKAQCGDITSPGIRHRGSSAGRGSMS